MTDTAVAPDGPVTEGWWPSRYGPDDEAGALNEITAAKIVEATSLVQHLDGLNHLPARATLPRSS